MTTKISFKKLHIGALGPWLIIRKLGSNAYVLDLADSLGISPIFNMEDLTRGTLEPPHLPFRVFVGIQVSRLPFLSQ